MSLLWIKPSIDYNKVNVKAVFRSPNRTAGVGIVLRDDEGDWLGGYAGNIGTATPITAELWAIYYGLLNCWNLIFQRIIVETDSQEAFDHVINPNPSFAMSSLVEMITFLINKEWQCTLSLAKENANTAAKFMADLGVQSIYGLAAYDNPPRALVPILDNDLVAEEVGMANVGDNPPPPSSSAS